MNDHDRLLAALPGHVDREAVKREMGWDECDRLRDLVSQLRAGARDIAYGDYANVSAREMALTMLRDSAPLEGNDS